MSQHLFDGLVATPQAPNSLRRLLQRRGSFKDGCFSRVVFTSSRWVTKVTSCPATALLLDELVRLPKGITGLPRVRESLGEVAINTWERQMPPLHGYVVERLVEESPDMADGSVRRYIEQVHSIRGEWEFGESPANDALLARKFARESTFGPRVAWEYLADFLLRHEMVLDSIERRNFLLTLAGQVCLADAVTFPPSWLEQQEAA